MKKPSKMFIKEMEKMYPKGATISPKKAAPFKPCAKCPNPAKCAKMGACMMKAKAK